MNLSRSVLFLLFLLPFTFLQAQTADEIVNKHVDAIGGKEVINKIKSQVIYSDVSVRNMTGSIIRTTLIGKGFKSVGNFGGNETIECNTPTSGWNRFNGDIELLPDDMVKAGQSELYVGGDLFDYKTKGNKVELMGRETVEGVNTYKLKLENKNGKTTFYFIDPFTYYIIKQESTTKVNGEDVASGMTFSFSNHKKTDIGLVIPYTTVLHNLKVTYTVSKVEFNKEIDPKIFEMPK